MVPSGCPETLGGLLKKVGEFVGIQKNINFHVLRLSKVKSPFDKLNLDGVGKSKKNKMNNTKQIQIPSSPIRSFDSEPYHHKRNELRG